MRRILLPEPKSESSWNRRGKTFEYPIPFPIPAPQEDEEDKKWWEAKIGEITTRIHDRLHQSVENTRRRTDRMTISNDLIQVQTLRHAQWDIDNLKQTIRRNYEVILRTELSTLIQECFVRLQIDEAFWERFCSSMLFFLRELSNGWYHAHNLLLDTSMWIFFHSVAGDSGKLTRLRGHLAEKSTILTMTDAVVTKVGSCVIFKGPKDEEEFRQELRRISS